MIPGPGHAITTEHLQRLLAQWPAVEPPPPPPEPEPLLLTEAQAARCYEEGWQIRFESVG